MELDLEEDLVEGLGPELELELGLGLGWLELELELGLDELSARD